MRKTVTIKSMLEGARIVARIVGRMSVSMLAVIYSKYLVQWERTINITFSSFSFPKNDVFLGKGENVPVLFPERCLTKVSFIFWNFSGIFSLFVLSI